MGAYQHHGWRENDVCGTLTAGQNDTVRGDTPLACLPAVANTLTARADGSPQPDKKSGANVVVQGVVDTCQNTGSKQQSLVTSENKENTLGANDYKEPKIAVYAMQAFGLYKESEVASSLKQRDYKDATDLICGVDCRNLTEHPELYPTLQAHSGGGYSINYSGAIRVQYIVRRLTPNECARLQGFPDWWDADVEGSDSARYKMWGNGIALPCAEFVLRRIAEFVRIERMGW